MIEERTTTNYRVICDECDDSGPEAVSKSEAIIAAKLDNWYILVEWNGLENIETMFCPGCANLQYGED